MTDHIKTPQTVDEWIRKLAETTSGPEALWMHSQGVGKYSPEDYADTVNEHENTIRWHLFKAGLIPKV